MKHTEVVGQPCPTCGQQLDAATCLGEDAVPSPGDFTVCFYCGTPFRFGAKMYLQLMTLGELNELEPAKRSLLFRAITEVQKRRTGLAFQ